MILKFAILQMGIGIESENYENKFWADIYIGMDKPRSMLKELFYWPGHYNDVQRWCAT